MSGKVPVDEAVFGVVPCSEMGLSCPSGLDRLLCAMEPALNDGVYVYAIVPEGMDLACFAPVVTIREQEGWTVIVEERVAEGADLAVLFRAAWITLNVHSDLGAVGFTAAITAACAQAGIACNVVAGALHDHLFVPVDAAGAALGVLRDLQRSVVDRMGGLSKVHGGGIESGLARAAGG